MSAYCPMFFLSSTAFKPGTMASLSLASSYCAFLNAGGPGVKCRLSLPFESPHVKGSVGRIGSPPLPLFFSTACPMGLWHSSSHGGAVHDGWKMSSPQHHAPLPRSRSLTILVALSVDFTY